MVKHKCERLTSSILNLYCVWGYTLNKKILGSQNEIQILDMVDEKHFDAIKMISQLTKGFHTISLVLKRTRLCPTKLGMEKKLSSATLKCYSSVHLLLCFTLSKVSNHRSMITHVLCAGQCRSFGEWE